jgi:hypothetical protein
MQWTSPKRKVLDKELQKLLIDADLEDFRRNVSFSK